MHSLYVERRSLYGKTPLCRDLAHHIYLNNVRGKVAIVANKPLELLSVTKKQWHILIRQLRRERSSTLDRTRIAELSQQIIRMENLKFTAKPPKDLLEADITFATAESFVRVPPECPTVYVTYAFEKEKLHMLTSWMPRSGRVIIYEEGQRISE